jgi:hypothetical protein
LVAVDLIRGALQLTEPTLKQPAVLADVSLGYIVTAGRLSSEERAKLACGFLSISHLHRRRRRADAELDRIIEQFGAEAIWRALERYTQPGSNEITVHEAAE